MAHIEVKTREQLLLMRRAGRVVADGLQAMQAAATAGMTTAELDGVGREVLAAAGARSNFLGYGAEYGTPFNGVACISVNEELVHGMPGDRVLNEGDVISVDFGAIVEGWHADAARTFILGPSTPEDETLVEVTRAAMWAGVAAVRSGGRVNDVSRAIEDFVLAQPRRYGTLREYTGHGIGSEMHMEPDVPNFSRRRPTPKLDVGMAIAIEPMLTLGLHQTSVCEDDWTVVSRDGSRGAHWEHTVAITPTGLWVLTSPDGGEAELVARGAPFGPLGD
ncbi:type I methionyl aminopeptidase [Tessaracoccus sp. OS52]|uniref:type I methionyl aminopeptidase n=1 Tax=Tessaracoccus sp. OS52 TaxID=2886691 RepID=UPI001D121819|nr:type I methionyl aminopeptidase [Tessaracoccus sp. OS52]